MSHFKTRHGILMLSFTVHPFDRVNATEAKEMLSTSILWYEKPYGKFRRARLNHREWYIANYNLVFTS
jgi:hypothetical protein